MKLNTILINFIEQAKQIGSKNNLTTKNECLIGKQMVQPRPPLPLPGKWLVCHTMMMDCRCFWVVLYVCLSHVWALTRVRCNNLSREQVSCHSWNSHRPGQIWKTENVEPLFLASYVMPYHDDGPQVFLSGIVCLFGSCMGSDKGAMWLFHVGRSRPPLLKLSQARPDLENWKRWAPLPGKLCYATPWWWTSGVSEWYCMFVWVMHGLWQGCDVTISCCRKESATTLETLTGQARFGKQKALSPSSWQVMLCHTMMMDLRCFRVVLYVCLGHVWALTRVRCDYLFT